MVGVILNGLEAVFDGCALLLSFFKETIVFSFNLSYVVGQLIVKAVLTLLSTTNEVFVVLRTLLVILQEDSIVFLTDVISKFSFLQEMIEMAVDYSTQTLKILMCTTLRIIGSICTAFLCSVQTFINFVSQVPFAVQFICILVKDALLLVGTTSWSIFSFFPIQIVLLKRFLVSLAVSCMIEVRNCTIYIQSYMYQCLSHAFVSICNMPLEALYGLCLFMISCLVLLKYWRNIYPSSLRCLTHLFNQSQRTLLVVWNYLEMFTLWLLTNQRNAAFTGTNALGSTATGETLSENDLGGSGFHPHQRESGSHSLKPTGDTKYLQDQEDLLCVVCQDEERSTIILPCKHVCLCSECCTMIKRAHGRCPVCRNVVRRTMRVYI